MKSSVYKVVSVGGKTSEFLDNLQFEIDGDAEQYWASKPIEKYDLPFIMIDSKNNMIYKWVSYEYVDTPNPHPRPHWCEKWKKKQLIKLMGDVRKIPFVNVRDVLRKIGDQEIPKQTPNSMGRSHFVDPGTNVDEEEKKKPVVIPAPLNGIRTELVCVMYIRMNRSEYKFIHNRGVGGRDIVDIAYRPDLRMELVSFHLITEIDEHAHKGYQSDEQRELDIAAKLMKKCVFIRYNPDHEDSSLDELIRWIKYYMDNEKAIEFSDDKWGILRHPLFYD
jgi:hypothetical protein